MKNDRMKLLGVYSDYSTAEFGANAGLWWMADKEITSQFVIHIHVKPPNTAPLSKSILARIRVLR